MTYTISNFTKLLTNKFGKLILGADGLLICLCVLSQCVVFLLLFRVAHYFYIQTLCMGIPRYLVLVGGYRSRIGQLGIVHQVQGQSIMVFPYLAATPLALHHSIPTHVQAREHTHDFVLQSAPLLERATIDRFRLPA